MAGENGAAIVRKLSKKHSATPGAKLFEFSNWEIVAGGGQGQSKKLASFSRMKLIVRQAGNGNCSLEMTARGKSQGWYNNPLLGSVVTIHLGLLDSQKNVIFEVTTDQSVSCGKMRSIDVNQQASPSVFLDASDGFFSVDSSQGWSKCWFELPEALVGRS
jgi:hypothetical protein